MKSHTQEVATSAIQHLDESLRKFGYLDADIAYVELAILELLRKRYDK